MSKPYDYEKSVALIYENDSHRGPGKVVQNLKLGLEKIGVSVIPEYSGHPWKYTGCLQFCKPQLISSYASTGRPMLMGPNLFVLPTDNPSLCKLFQHFVVPSEWVKKTYQEFDLMNGKNIHVWSVGIDTDVWKPSEQGKTGDIDCIVYFKNRSDQDLAVVEAICRKFDLKYELFKYGSYLEQDLHKSATTKAKFAILCTGTESQGIAYMQLLSAGLPCYVFNNPLWKSEDGKHTAVASSVPYFDERCGYVINNVDLDHFKEFLKNIDNFHPRDYILDKHTLEEAAQKYFDLLRTSNGEQL